MKTYSILKMKGYLKKQRYGKEYVLICTICNEEVNTRHYFWRHRDIYYEVVSEALRSEVRA